MGILYKTDECDKDKFTWNQGVSDAIILLLWKDFSNLQDWICPQFETNSHKVSHWGAQLGADQITTLISFSAYFRPKKCTHFFQQLLFYFIPLKNFGGLGLGPVGVLKIFPGSKKVSPPALPSTLVTSVSLSTAQDYRFCTKIRQFCSVHCPSWCCWKFSSPMKMVFRFWCSAGSVQCLFLLALNVVVSLSVTVLVTSTNHYPAVVQFSLNLCIFHSWGLVAFQLPWTWVCFQNSSQVQSLSFLHCCCFLSSDPALSPTTPRFSFASEYFGGELAVPSSPSIYSIHKGTVVQLLLSDMVQCLHPIWWLGK